MSPASYFATANILNIFGSLPVGVMMISPEGHVLHVNQALSNMTGFTPEQAKGLPCRFVLRSKPCVSGCSMGCRSFGAADTITASPAPLESLSPGLEVMLREGGMRSLETDILTLKKRRVPVRITHFPVLDADGSILFYLDAVEDLTELKNLESRLHEAKGHGRLIGRSGFMEKLLALIPSIAPSASPVFLTGETGTGKDILAETLHRESHRSREPFVRLNMAPLPEDLLLADIFGQVDSGPQNKTGRFLQASGGTLYITELADIPLPIQTRLVHYLDTGTIVPVGAAREITPNVRLITATNRDPEKLLQNGVLNSEFFYRLNVIRLDLPPLRERKEDIDFLLSHFLEMFATRFKKKLLGFAPEVREVLVGHDYLGNIRELRNIVEYAAMVCTTSEIRGENLPASFAMHFLAKNPPEQARTDTDAAVSPQRKQRQKSGSRRAGSAKTSGGKGI